MLVESVLLLEALLLDDLNSARMLLKSPIFLPFYYLKRDIDCITLTLQCNPLVADR
jgi:hypothetical protein